MSMSKEMDEWQKAQEEKHGIVTLSCPHGLSKKQAYIWDHIVKHGRITSAEAVKLVGVDIYDNASKHVGSLLARMVDRKMIVRIKPGVFEFPKSRE